MILRLSEYLNSRLKPIEDRIAENLLASGKSKEIVEVFRKYKLIIRRKQEQRSLDRDAARADDLSDVFTGLSVSGGRKSRRHSKKGKAHKPASTINTIKRLIKRLIKRYIKLIRRRNTRHVNRIRYAKHTERVAHHEVGRRDIIKFNLTFNLIFNLISFVKIIKEITILIIMKIIFIIILHHL